jgi:hypothetical protein
MVGHSGESSNHLFNILAEWNSYLEASCSGIYDPQL